MKKFTAGLFALLLICLSSSLWATDSVDELLSLNARYEKTFAMPLEAAVAQEAALKSQEAVLVDQILAQPADLSKLVSCSSQLYASVLQRLIQRLQFRIAQEDRKEYRDSLQALQKSAETTVRGKKKVASIGGCEVNLRDGEWRESPDGRQYWVSNEYPDIVLTPAEYRKYAASAVIVEED